MHSAPLSPILSAIQPSAIIEEQVILCLDRPFVHLQMSEDHAETKPKVENAAAVINLVVKDQEGEVHFKVHYSDNTPLPAFVKVLLHGNCKVHSWPAVTQVKSHTKMQKIMEAYAQKKGIDATQIRFLFDGKRLQHDQTPTELDMEVHAVPQ